MTVLALQRVSFNDLDTGCRTARVFVAADSRISREETTTTDIAPKILPINMSASDASGNRWQFPPYGFAFAGSVNAALLTHSVAEHLLTNLFAPKVISPPSVQEVAEIYREAAKRQIVEIGTRLSPDYANAALFDAIVCGYSIDKNAVCAFSVEAKLGRELCVQVREIDTEAGIFTIGAGKKRFDEIKQIMNESGKEPFCVNVIARMIKNSEHPTVGGHIQAATIDSSGFHQLTILDFSDDQQLGRSRYLNIDMNDIPHPQGYKFGQMGITLDGPSAEKLASQGNLMHTDH